MPQSWKEKNQLYLKVSRTIREPRGHVAIDLSYPVDLGLLPYGQPTIEDAKEFYSLALRVFDDVGRMLDR